MDINFDTIFSNDNGKSLFVSLAIEHAPEQVMQQATQSQTYNFVVDSGATAHFVGDRVPISDQAPYSSKVEVAGGKHLDVTYCGTCSGTTGNGKAVTFKAKRCPDMKYNIFSVYQAAKDGSRTVLRGQSGWQLAIDTNQCDSAQPAEES